MIAVEAREAAAMQIKFSLRAARHLRAGRFTRTGERASVQVLARGAVLN